MKVILFDMDGTLTEARQKINHNMVMRLTDLQAAGYKVGIVTGSNMDYVLEQCNLLFEDWGFDHRNAYWFPCNGTIQYRFTKSGKMVKASDANMIKKIGLENYRKLIACCIEIQKHILDTTNCPATGTFFDYRGSTLNWCPIGRSASLEDRLVWVDIDREKSIRLKCLHMLRSSLDKNKIKNIDIKLGGDTSFDIFPVGWDKTYVLRHFKETDELWFIGDRCKDTGNDKELYDAIKLRAAGDSFETTGPSKTISIINKNILQHSDYT